MGMRSLHEPKGWRPCGDSPPLGEQLGVHKR